MRAASRGQRTVQWLHGALAVGIALSTLVATAPLRGVYAEPIDQVRGPSPGTGGAQTGGGVQAPGVGGVPVRQVGIEAVVRRHPQDAAAQTAALRVRPPRRSLPLS